jgi:metal transporter CNNM
MQRSENSLLEATRRMQRRLTHMVLRSFLLFLKCSRYALRIGSMAVPLVRIIRAIFYPIAKPLAYGLDVALGAELATTYSSAEMMKLLQIHVQQNVIDQETAGAMTGALTYKNMKVKDVMTTMDRTFMLNVDDKLSFETIAKIFKTGYSRIPIYEITRDNIIGLLFVKDLIFIDPEDEVPIRSFVQIFGRGVHVVWPDDTLGDVLAELKKGRTHLALVRDVNNADETQDPYYEVKGIITLEDIIEKIIGDTIVDETDEYVDSTQEVKVERGEGFEWARLRLLDTKIVDDLLSPSEVKAVTAHFRVNFSKTVELLTDTQLSRLVATTPVATLETAKQQLGQDLPKDLLYKKGTPSDVFTLILGGKVTVLVGNEDFRSDVSSWSVLGKSALEKSDFTPDFTAFVSDGPCRCLRISHLDFVSAVDASAIERTAAETQANAKRTTSIGSIDDNSTASSDVPNRREKLLAQLFRKESIDNPIAAELNTDIKEPVIKEEEAGEVKVGRIDSKDADEGNGDANDNEDTTSSTENGGEQAT